MPWPHRHLTARPSGRCYRPLTSLSSSGSPTSFVCLLLPLCPAPGPFVAETLPSVNVRAPVGQTSTHSAHSSHRDFAHGLVRKRGHPASKAPVGKTQSCHARLAAADPDTLAAEHALVGVIHEERAAGIHGQVPRNLSEAPSPQVHLEMGGYLLQLASTALRAVGAVHVVAG